MNTSLKEYVTSALTNLIELGARGKVDLEIWVKPRWDEEKEIHVLEVQSKSDSTCSRVKFSVEIRG